MQIFDTTKLYLGFPVYIISTTDREDNILVATMSSSYTLGDILIIGMSKLGHTAQQLTIDDKIAVNYLSSEQGLLADVAGFSSGEDNKIKAADLQTDFQFHNTIPYLSNSMVTLFATITQIVEDENYYHMFLKIDSRMVNENLLNDREKLIYKKIDPLLYLGDGARRAYKSTKENITFSGSFLKDSKK